VRLVVVDTSVFLLPLRAAAIGRVQVMHMLGAQVAGYETFHWHVQEEERGREEE